MSAPADAPARPQPTPPTPARAPTSAQALRRAAPLLALLAGAVVAAVLALPYIDTGLPLDPASSRPDGTRALVDVLRGVGRSVDVISPRQVGDAPDVPADQQVVLLLIDQLDSAQRDRLRERVASGAHLVVTDPTSAFTQTPTGAVSLLDRSLEPGCEVRALDAVHRVRPTLDAVFTVPDGATGCFRTEDGAWLVIEPVGRGHVVTIGGATFLTNQGLREEDNAVLAVHLLTPGAASHTQIVRPVLPGHAGTTGQQDLVDLMSPGVRAALLQLALGFLVLAAWRARRLGTPLVDVAPVRLAGADLTAAIGALLGHHDARAAAAERIAAATRRRLARQLNLAESTPLELLAEDISARTGKDRTAVQRTLDPPPPRTDEELLRVTTALSELEQTLANDLRTTLEDSDAR